MDVPMRKIGPLVASGHKCCFRCASVKTTVELYSHRTRPDRLSSQCKVCARATQAQSREIKKHLLAAFEFFAAHSGAGLIELPALILQVYS